MLGEEIKSIVQASDNRDDNRDLHCGDVLEVLVTTPEGIQATHKGTMYDETGKVYTFTLTNISEINERSI